MLDFNFIICEINLIINSKQINKRYMSFFGRIKSIFVEKIVQDEFYQPISQQQIYAVLNNKHQSKISQNAKRISQEEQKKQENVLHVALSVSEHTPEIEFRLLGYQPTIQTISNKVNSLRHKLNIIDSHLLLHYESYLKNINSSLEFFSEGKEFYSTRKKGAELRFIIEKMNKVLSKSKVITKLNITIKNLKNTLKLLQKIPNIKKMNLIELKSIDLQKLQKINQQVFTIYKQKLACLTNLSKYITKVNNQSFVYIINNLKMCLDNYDQQVYEEIMRSYLIIQPQTLLEKLLASLVEEKIRQIFDNSQGLQVLGRHLIELMINIHKIIKWHIINKAVKTKQKANESQTLSSNQSESESKQGVRRLSITSDQSQEAIQIQLNEIVYISIQNIKQIFNKGVDNSLTDLTTDNLISIDIQSKQLYNHLQIISKISEICHNFTGLSFNKLKKTFVDYFNRKENNLFIKYSKQLVSSIQQQRNDWNRLAFPNNFKCSHIDRLLYRWTKIVQIQQYKKIVLVINKLFSEEVSFLDQSSQSEQQESLQLNIRKMESIQRLQKKFQEWKPSKYLELYQGDVIICQSTNKLLGIFQKYTQLLIYTPAYKNIHTYYEHMLLLIQYQIYFIFNSLLSSKYRNLFFQQITPEMSIQKIYTLKRFKSLYPKITSFVNSFKSLLENQTTNQTYRLIVNFKKDIKQIHNSQENHVLRAKVIATQSIKYCLAYFHQILKTNPFCTQQPAFKRLFERIEDTRVTIGQLSILLLTESSQNLVSVELQTIKSLFQSIRWYEPYEQLREYVHKIVGMVREAYQKLKSCNRGEVPLDIISFIFIFIWRTILTYSVKLFLQNKSNNKRENKLNFQKFIDQLYNSFQNRYNSSLSGLVTAYNIFKSIFKILLCSNWQQCKELLIETMKKYDYIYPILISLMENSEYMSSLPQRQKQAKRLQFKEQIQFTFKQKK